jgi:hypothetical protein
VAALSQWGEEHGGSTSAREHAAQQPHWVSRSCATWDRNVAVYTRAGYMPKGKARKSPVLNDRSTMSAGIAQHYCSTGVVCDGVRISASGCCVLAVSIFKAELTSLIAFDADSEEERSFRFVMQ